MTGPSLGGVWGRKAGTVAGFARYSDALKRSGLVWDERHLDEWLTNPAAVVPGNARDFPGIADARTRADLLAYLKAVSTGRVSAPDRGLPNLKEADAASQAREQFTRAHFQQVFGKLAQAGNGRAWAVEAELKI